MRPVEIMYNHLNDGGVIPAGSLPFLEWFDESDPEFTDDKIGIAITQPSRGGGDYMIKAPQIAISLMSGANGATYEIRQTMEAIESYLDRNYEKDCMFTCSVIGTIGGPYRMDSGRRAYDLVVEMRVSTGIAQ